MIKISLDNGIHTLNIDKLAFGTGCFSDYADKESYFLLMDRFYENFKTFDTARSYNEWLPDGKDISEYMLGEWMNSRKNRNNVVVVTKGGFPKNLKIKKDVQNRLTKEDLQFDIDTSLATLKTDYVDIFLLHRDDLSKPVEYIIPILQDFIKQGKTRFIGVSNWTSDRIEKAQDFIAKEKMIPLSISQCYFSLAESSPEKFDDDTIVCINRQEYKWYERSRIPLMAFTSQAKGFFSKYNSIQLKQSEIKRFVSEINIERAKRARMLANEYSVSPTCIALAYLVNNPVQTCAVIGPKNISQLEDSINVKEILLSKTQIDWLIGE